jgi:hypothetical protein
MGDFLAFRRMITPILIQIVFWLGLVGCVAFGAYLLVKGHDNREKAAGAALLFGGPIVIRVYCEILIVVFRINETLTDIRTNTMR